MPTKLSDEWETVFEEFHKQRNKQTIIVPDLKPVFHMNGENGCAKPQILLNVPEMVKNTGIKAFRTSKITITPDKQYVITLARSEHQEKFSSFVSAIFELTGGATSSKTWGDRWIELQSHKKTETNQMAGKRNLPFHETTQPNPKQPKYSENFFLCAFERNSYTHMKTIPLTDVSAAGITCDGGQLLLVNRNPRKILLFRADTSMQLMGDRVSLCDYPYAICAARGQIWLTDKQNNGKICTLPRIQGQAVQIIENGYLNEPSGIAAGALGLLICEKKRISMVPLASSGVPLANHVMYKFPDTAVLTDIAFSQVTGSIFVSDSGNNCIWEAFGGEIQKLNIDTSNTAIQNNGMCLRDHKLNNPTGICIYSQTTTEVKLLVSDMDRILEFTVIIHSGRMKIGTNCIHSDICFSKICTNGENIFAVGIQPSKPPPTDSIVQQQQCVNETPPDTVTQQPRGFGNGTLDPEIERFLLQNDLFTSELNEHVDFILRTIPKLFRFITTCPEQSELFKRVTTVLAVAHDWLNNPQTEAQRNINPTIKAWLLKRLKIFTKDKKSKFLPEGDDYAVNVSNNGQQEPKIGDIVAIDYESMSFNSTLDNCGSTLGVVSWRYNMLFGDESPGSVRTPVAFWGMVFVRVYANSASKKIVTYDKNCFVVKNMNIMDGIGELVTLDELLTLDSNYQIVGTCRKKDNELILYQNKHEIPEDIQLEWEDGIIYTVIDLPPMLDTHFDFFFNSIPAFNDPLNSDYSETFSPDKQDTDTAPHDFDQFLNPILPHGPHLTAKRNKNIMPIINAPLTAYPIREITEMPVNDLRQLRITDGTNDGLEIRENNAEQFEPVDENIPVPRYKPSNHFEDKEKGKEHIYLTFGVGGRSGCGKTTFAKEVLGIENIDDEKRTTGIVIHKRYIETNSTVFHLTFIDSPGIGDDATAEQTLVPLILEMKRRYKACARGDTSYDNAPVLWIFYLVCNNRLTGNDKRCIRLLSKYTSIIPLIAKAETYQKHEILSYQEEVHKEIANMNVNILKIPVHKDFKDSYPYKWMYPYPIMGKTRNYPWTKGILAEVNDPNISSTVMLKYSLFSKADEENNFHCRILALPERYKGTNTICNIYAKRFRSPHSYFSYRAWRDEFQIFYLQHSMLIVLLALLLIFIVLVCTILKLTGQL